MCKCTRPGRLVKTRSQRWVCSRCGEERGPFASDQQLVRHDVASGTAQEANLATMQHELRREDLDPEGAIESLVTSGEALTADAVYELVEA